MNDQGGRLSTIKLPLPDQVIAGRYRLLSRLGSGGMGLVFLAEQLGVGNQVAMKFLDPEPSADDSRVARFLREAKVALEVKHPGAAQLLDLGRDEAMRLFLVFEYVEGTDLRELLRDEGRLHFDEARTIALKVAETLAFAHERGIVHRDVKPENIRVRRDLAGVHVKVLDFGIARLLKDGGVRLTAEGSLAGTPRYMSPEQIRDLPVDGRTDCYALGLVFFEMLTGAPAFQGRNISQLLVKQVQDPLPTLESIAPELGAPAIDAFLARACAKDMRERFQTMAEFVQALRALQVSNWPAPRSSLAERREPTRSRAALSDTVVRVEHPTEAALPAPRNVDEAWEVREPEVPTEPEREAVKRREPSVEAPKPVEARETRPSKRQPTEAPAVDPLRATTLGSVAPPAPPRRRSFAVVALALLVVLAVAGIVAARWMGALLSH